MSLGWRITSAYLVLILAVLLDLALYIASFTRSMYLGQLEAQLADDAAVAAGQDDDRRLGRGAQLAQELQPGAVRQGQVEHHQVGLSGRLTPLGQPPGPARLEALLVEHVGQRLGNADLVFDDQDPTHHSVPNRVL